MLDYPTPAVAGRIKTTRVAGFLARHHNTGRVPAQVLSERMWIAPGLMEAVIPGKDDESHGSTEEVQR